MTADQDEATLQLLLDLSSAFDTVDHATLLLVLEQQFFIEGSALMWFQSYLSDYNDYSPLRTLRRDWLPVREDLSTSRQCCSHCTGYLLGSGLSTNSQH